MEQEIDGLVAAFERGGLTRRGLIKALTVLAVGSGSSAPALAQRQRLHTTGVHHLSFQVGDYARTRDFYAGLLDLRVSDDDRAARQCQLHAGDTSIFARTARPGRRPPMVDHVALAVSNWDKRQIEDELKSRGLPYTRDAQFPDQSVHLRDPDGFDLQIISDRVKS